MAEISKRKRIWGWWFFDWASQPYHTLLVTFVFGPYFAGVAAGYYANTGLETEAAAAQAQTVWANCLTITGLIIDQEARPTMTGSAFEVDMLNVVLPLQWDTSFRGADDYDNVRGGLAVWAILEIIFINRRDGQWQRPGAAAIRLDVIPIVIGTAVFAAVLRFHSTLFGVTPY